MNPTEGFAAAAATRVPTTEHRVHSDDVPTPYAYNLEQEYLPNTRKVCEAVRSATYNA